MARKMSDPEIHFIAWWLKTNTRHAERVEYLITFRELEAILRKRNCYFANIYNNQADIMRKELVTKTRKKLLFVKEKYQETEIKKVCRIGFPGWSKVVGKGIITHVRQQLSLTMKNGVDSQAFFNGKDDMTSLMRQYRGALERLAYR